MCGISVIASPEPVPSLAIRAMTDLVSHRGRDDEGYLVVTGAGATPLSYGGPATPSDAYSINAAFAPGGSIEAAPAGATVAFGHRRLSILDLSSLGHQPMCTPDRRYWITYNGEIYNYLELAQELAKLGHRFLSHCDTEVILAAYAEWGSGALERLNGMWAFAIYDARAHELFAARDRFGIKPLYYWFSPRGVFCLASEIKQFTAIDGWQAVVNPDRAASFLTTGLTDDRDQTLFEGVFQVGAGKYLRADVATLTPRPDGRVATTKWYQLEPAAFNGSFEDAALECRRLLTHSVSLMLRSDVPVGSCLSGGLDSSSIVCTMNQLLRERGAESSQKTFSSVPDDAALNEQQWIDEVVRATRVDAHFTKSSFSDFDGALTRLSFHQDEPFTSTSVFAQWSVFELAAAAGIKVMLDGQGADEAFFGYQSFFGPYLGGLWRRGRAVAVWREIRQLQRRHRFPTTSALGALARASRPGASPRHYDPRALSREQLTRSNLPMLLRFEDRNSMAHSIESRVPFLDHHVVEFALGLPDHYKLGGGVTKRVLRQAMRGFHTLGQEELSRMAIEPYFEMLPKLGTIQDEEFARRFAGSMYPSLCDPVIVQRTSAALSAHSNLPAAVVKALKVGKQEEERCIRARAKSQETLSI